MAFENTFQCYLQVLKVSTWRHVIFPMHFWCFLRSLRYVCRSLLRLFTNYAILMLILLWFSAWADQYVLNFLVFSYKFLPNVPFWSPLKAPGNQRFFDVFRRGGEKEHWKWVQCELILTIISANPTKWSNTLTQVAGFCWRFVWMCLTILWDWHLKG